MIVETLTGEETLRKAGRERCVCEGEAVGKVAMTLTPSDGFKKLLFAEDKESSLYLTVLEPFSWKNASFSYLHITVVRLLY